MNKQDHAAKPKFILGDHVRKIRGSAWSGQVVGTYSTKLTPEGYAVESDAHPGSVQIYPAAALELDAPPPCSTFRSNEDRLLDALQDLYEAQPQADYAGWVAARKEAEELLLELQPNR